MNYEILALDLDGTLTNSKKEITPPTREAIINMQKQGKKLVLASGRPTHGALPVAEELRLEEYGSFILSYNGARITNCATGEVIYNKTLPDNILSEIYDITSMYDVNLITYSETQLISDSEPNEYTIYESRTERMDIVIAENFVDYVDFPMNKCVFVGNPAIIPEIEQILLERYHDSLSIYRSEPFFVEIMPQNVNKAVSLEKLLNRLGLSRNQLIACGDGYNDITMIEYAGLGVAMENAQPEVKEKADYITKSNDEDGVLHVIETFIDIE